MNLRYRDNPAGDDMARKISNSEVDAFLTCERKHYYSYRLHVQPKERSSALARGIVGHEILADYYQALMDGKSYEEAVLTARTRLGQFMAEANPFDLEMLYALGALLESYYEFARDDKWTILAVEKQYDLPINEDFEYSMRLDLLARIDGEVTLVDHKFVYNFYTQDELDMNIQIPKYIGTLKYHGIPVERGMLNQIRHRVNKGYMAPEEKYRRSYIKPMQQEIRNVLREQIVASSRIVDRRAMSQEEHSAQALRTMNKMVCKNCPVQPLCKAELQGTDISMMLKVDYERNEYGYNKEAAEPAST